VFRSDEESRGWALFYTAVDFLNAPTLREAIDTAMAMLDAKEGA
jgi:hypothetical protein